MNPFWLILFNWVETRNHQLGMVPRVFNGSVFTKPWWEDPFHGWDFSRQPPPKSEQLTRYTIVSSTVWEPKARWYNWYGGVRSCIFFIVYIQYIYIVYIYMLHIRIYIFLYLYTKVSISLSICLHTVDASEIRLTTWDRWNLVNNINNGRFS